MSRQPKQPSPWHSFFTKNLSAAPPTPSPPFASQLQNQYTQQNPSAPFVSGSFGGPTYLDPAALVPTLVAELLGLKPEEELPETLEPFVERLVRAMDDFFTTGKPDAARSFVRQADELRKFVRGDGDADRVAGEAVAAELRRDGGR